MGLTEAQKIKKNEQRVKQRAEKAAAKKTVPRDGAREEVINKMMNSVMKKVIQKAKARDRTKRWKDDHPEQKKQIDTDRYDRDKRLAAERDISYEQHMQEKRDATSKKPAYDANQRHKDRKKNDPEFLVVTRLRTRLCEFMKLTNGTKAEGTMQLVGCSKDHLVNHLSSQLAEGETLQENSIDHIFPMSCYDMTDPAEQRRCMNFTNLRPMRLYGIGGNVSIGNNMPSLELAHRVARDCWPAAISETDLF
tara:strand:+ start:122 stop:871 length:750 start_codon:yes stop_codon:yes gene_type:complete